jgi:hypothetical protein
MMTMKKVVPCIAGLAAIAVAACGGKSPAEPAAAPPPAAEPSAGGEATPVEPQVDAPASEPAEPPPPDPAELAAAEQSAYELAEPIFKQYCAKCHAKGGSKARRKSLKHFDMTSYPFGGHHAAEITAEIREVLAIGGGKAIMPKDKPGSVQGPELSLISDWADAYDKAHAAAPH